MAQENQKGKITVGEAGQRGGQTTSEKYGPEFYEDIGHRGGQATASTHGRDFYERIGKKGGSIGGPRVRELINRGKERG